MGFRSKRRRRLLPIRFAGTIPDPDHSSGEARFLTIGMISNERLIVVSHIEEGDTIRIISARQATAHERKQYES